MSKDFSRQTVAPADNGAENGDGKLARNGKVARDEAALMQAYMDLTGRSETQARSVLIFVLEKNHNSENGATAEDTLNGANGNVRPEFEESRPRSSHEPKEDQC